MPPIFNPRRNWLSSLTSKGTGQATDLLPVVRPADATPGGNMTASQLLATPNAGPLPITSGGTNNSSAYTTGSIPYFDGTKLAQDTNLTWDSSGRKFGPATIAGAGQKFTVNGQSSSGSSGGDLFLTPGSGGGQPGILNLCSGSTGGPTLGQAYGKVMVTAASGLYGLLTAVDGNGDSWLQCQRNDAGTGTYNLYLQGLGGLVKIGGTGAPTAQTHILSSGINTVGLIVDGPASWNADALRVNVNGSTLAKFTKDVYLAIGASLTPLAPIHVKTADNYQSIWENSSAGNQFNAFRATGSRAAEYGIYSDDLYFQAVTSLNGIAFYGSSASTKHLYVKPAGTLIAQTVQTSGSPTALTVTGGAHTTLAASTEAVDINFNLNRTVQFATGAYAGSQRAVLIQAPTYNTVAASSYAGATLATLAVSGAPATGGNISGSPTTLALWVQGGLTRFDGDLTLNTGLINSGLGASELRFNPQNISGRYAQAFDYHGTVVLASAGVLGWSNSSTVASINSQDVGLARNASKVLEVNTGTAGSFGALICGQPAIGTVGLKVQGIASRTAPIAQLQTSAGASLGNVSGGAVHDVLASVSTTHTDGTFDTLDTYTLPANGFIVNGDTLEFDYTLTTVANATAARDFKLAFAGITIFDSTADVFGNNAGTVRIFGYIERFSATTCRAHISFRPSGSSTILAFATEKYVDDTTLSGLTLTATNNLVLSAAASGAGAAASDITLTNGKKKIVGFGS